MGIVKTRTGWAIDYYRNGRRVQEYIGGSKTLAAQALARVRTETAQDRYFPDRPRGGDLLVSEILNRYWTGHLQYRKSPACGWWALELARKAFGSLALVDLCKEKIEAWMRAQEGRQWVSRHKDKKEPAKSYKGEVLTVKPATVNRIFQALNAAINYGIKTELIRGVKNPCSMVRKFPENNVRDRVLTEAEYDSLYRRLPDYLKPVLLFAYYTGCRKKEVLTLQKKDVDFFGNTVFIRNTKNDESRYVPMAPALREVLVELVRAYPESPYVFHYPGGRRIKEPGRAWLSAVRRLNLEGVVFHSLRHTALTNWHNAGHSHFLIMRASGHKTLSCFQRYLSFKNQDLQKLVLGKDGDNLETGEGAEASKAG